jgi:hypothetical protein
VDVAISHFPRARTRAYCGEIDTRRRRRLGRTEPGCTTRVSIMTAPWCPRLPYGGHRNVLSPMQWSEGPRYELGAQDARSR